MKVSIQFCILPHLSDDPLVISLAAFTSVLLIFLLYITPNPYTIFLLYITPNPYTIHCKKYLLGLVYITVLQKGKYISHQKS
jgi:hypothetical protein